MSPVTLQRSVPTPQQDINQFERELIEQELEIEIELEKRACEDKYSDFVKSAWEILEPGNPLIWNWHLDVLCEEMEYQIHRIGRRIPKEYDLIINVPPRSLKSMIFTRMPTPWAWIRYPWMRFMRGSYAEDLALDQAVESRDIIRSDWYQDNWGHLYRLKQDQDNKSHFKTNMNGACLTTSTTGKACGRGANIISLDDPLSPLQSDSELEREKAIRFLKRTIINRLNNPEIDLLMIIMQRLHEDDPTGYLLKTYPHRFKHICLPAEDCDWVSPPELRKFYVNGLLFPKRLSKETLDSYRDDAYYYAGQYMQRPSPEEGGIFKRQYWKYWKPAGMELPEVTVRIGDQTYNCEVVDLPFQMDEWICSWDTAFKDLKTSDNVAGSVWAKNGPNKFLIDERVEKMSYAKTCLEIKELKERYPKTTAILIEDKANGSAIISDLSKTIPGIIPVEPRGTKYSRAMPMSRQQAAGNLYLPHPALAKWVETYISEFAAFPNGSNDDRVDSGSQAIDYLSDVQRVWTAYKGDTVKFKIDFDNISNKSMVICSQWVEKSLKTSLLFALWNAKQGKLWIFDEYTALDAKPDPVIMRAIQILQNASGRKFTREDLQKINWIGNDLMFGNGGLHNLAGTYLTSPAQISILPNEFYDEYGAITAISRMFTMGQIILHSRTEGCKQQMSNWKIDGKEPEPGYGYCRALCNMVSMLFETGTMQRRETRLREYSPAKTRLLQQMKDAHDTGNIGDFVIGKHRNTNYSRRGKDGWIV